MKKSNLITHFVFNAIKSIVRCASRRLIRVFLICSITTYYSQLSFCYITFFSFAGSVGHPKSSYPWNKIYRKLLRDTVFFFSVFLFFIFRIPLTNFIYIFLLLQVVKFNLISSNLSRLFVVVVVMSLLKKSKDYWWEFRDFMAVKVWSLSFCLHSLVNKWTFCLYSIPQDKIC